MKIFSGLLLILFFRVGLAEAQSGLGKNYRVSKVRIDQAAVYSQPSFDAPITTYLPLNKSILIFFKNPRVGPGGLGLFYRIKYAKRKYGYMLDIDITKKNKSQQERPLFPPKLAALPAEDRPGNLPRMYQTRYAGMFFSLQNLEETLGGRNQKETYKAFGFKLSGPGSVGASTEFNLTYLPVPKYYTRYRNRRNENPIKQVKGFALIGDFSFIRPILEYKYFFAYYGVGLSATFTNFEVTVDENSEDDRVRIALSRDLNLGLAIPVGVSLRLLQLSKLIFKLEALCSLKKRSSLNFKAALQWAY